MRASVVANGAKVHRRAPTRLATPPEAALSPVVIRRYAYFVPSPGEADDLARRLERTEAELRACRAELESLRAAIHQAPAPLAILRGPELRYELSNPVNVAWTNGRARVGRTAEEALPEMVAQGFLEVVRRVYETGEPYRAHEVPLTIENEDGHPRHLYVNGLYHPLRGEDGKVEGILAAAFDVTEQVVARQKAEAIRDELTAQRAALEASQSRFRSLISAISHVVWTTDPSGLVLEDSPSWRELTGQTYEQWKGTGWLDALHPDDRPTAQQAWERAVRGKAPYQIVYRLRHRDGSYRYTMARGVPVLDEAGQIREWVGANIDITTQTLADQERERLVRELERSNAVFRAVLDTVPLGIALFDRELRFVEVNATITKGNELSREQHLGRTLEELFPGHPWNGVIAAYMEGVLASGEAKLGVELTWRSPTAEAVEHYSLANFFPVCLPHGDGHAEVVGCGLAFVDLTERRRIEQALRTSEERFRRIFESNMIGFVFSKSDGRIVDANSYFLQLLGRGASAADHDLHWDSLTPPGHAPLAQRIAEQLRGSGGREPFEQECVKTTGERVPALLGSAPLPSGAGADVVTYVLDIADRKRAEHSVAFLARTGSLLSGTLDVPSLLDHVLGLVVPELADACIIHLSGNDAPELAATGHRDPSKRALLARAMPTAPAPAFLPELTEAARAALAPTPEARRALAELGVHAAVTVPLAVHGRTLGTLTYLLEGGHRLEGDRRLAPADLALAEELARRVAMALDNARLFEAAQRERLRVEEANRAKDEFLAVVSHELRTPLNAILGWGRMLRSGTLDEARVQRGLETIERNALVQTQLIEDLLDISRIISGKLRLVVVPVDLVQVILAAIDTVRPAADARGVTIHAMLDPTAAALNGDPDRLQQVVWNLLSNAVKFTPKGGRVQVELSRLGASVEIVVSDTGKGIEPEFLPYVFDRFRQAETGTTRSPGGLGLGLAIVKHLVELHGGTTLADSAGSGLGATFSVRLPVAAPRPTPAPLKTAGAKAAWSTNGVEHRAELAGLKVLVVDDEPDARELLRTMLEPCRVVVRTAGSADEAFRALEDFVPDVLLSDIGMPGEDGYALLGRVRKLPPERGGRIPAVALTAYTRMEDRTRALLAGYTMHLSKPIEPAELLVVLATVSGRRRPS